MGVTWNFDQEKRRAAFAHGIEKKLSGVRCPTHGETPSVSFDESGKLAIRGCCDPLVAAAHARLGRRRGEAS